MGLAIARGAVKHCSTVLHFFAGGVYMQRKAIAILILLFLCACTLMAQEVKGSILGTVTDTSNAIVPRAKVTVTNTDRNAVLRTTTTDNNGYYVAPLLPVGHYAVSVAAQGFKTFSKTGIELNVSDRLTVNAELSPGSVHEVVTVEANALQVETQSPAAGCVLLVPPIPDRRVAAAIC